MTQNGLHRKTGLLFTAIAAILSFLGCTQNDDHQALKVHRVKSSALSFYSNAHIIEGENGLVVIDVHSDQEDVQRLTEKIKELKKPLDAIIITHPHFDHVNGLEYISKDFPTAKIYSGPKTVDAIKLNAPAWEISLNRIEILSEGKKELAGHKFHISYFEDSESLEALVLYDPLTNSVFTGDLVLNGQHLWLVERQLKNWISDLNALKEQLEIDVVYPGHGEKGSVEILDFTVEYIDSFLEVLHMGYSYCDARSKMVERFPKHEFPTALKYSLGAYGLLPNPECENE